MKKPTDLKEEITQKFMELSFKMPKVDLGETKEIWKSWSTLSKNE